MGNSSDRRQRKVLRTEENQGRNGFGWFVVAIVFGGLGIAAISGDQGGGSPLAGLAFLLVALMAVGALVGSAGRTSQARKVEQASRAPRRNAAREVVASAKAEARASDPPPLKVRFLKPQKFPRLPSKARRVRIDRNVIGRKPLFIAYFRMFANPPRVRTFMESAWREFGHVHFLQSADAVTPAEFKKVKGGDFFVASDREFIDALRGAGREPLRAGRHAVVGVRQKPVKVRDPFGAYPASPIPCHVDYWQRAVDLLLQQADLVVLDLSGFTESNAGTAYELQQIFDAFPIERVVFLCDPKSDRRFLEKVIQSAWSQLRARSPNAAGAARQVTCGITDRFQSVAVKSGQQAGGYVQLRSNRKETRRLAAAAQVAAEAASRRG